MNSSSNKEKILNAEGSGRRTAFCMAAGLKEDSNKADQIM
jgi:hypothetical protein